MAAARVPAKFNSNGFRWDDDEGKSVRPRLPFFKSNVLAAIKMLMSISLIGLVHRGA
jgi:hypothetical protein